MKAKHSAAALRQLALDGALAGCEARAFAAFHAATLDAATHIPYVEAFVLQLGAPAQHTRIVVLLGACDRAFRAGKIAYKPPDAALLTSVLDVARWVGAQLDGGLAHAHVLERAQRADAGCRRAAATDAALPMALAPPAAALPVTLAAELPPLRLIAHDNLLAAPNAPLAAPPLADLASPAPSAPLPATPEVVSLSVAPAATPVVFEAPVAPAGAPVVLEAPVAPAAAPVVLETPVAPAAAPSAVPVVSALAAAPAVAQRAMRALERRALLVPRAATLDLVAAHTRLLSAYVARAALVGDAAAAARMAMGEAPLLSLLDRGTQDRKELEALVCAALREGGGFLAFAAAEFLLDAELVALLGEADRREGARRADAYLIVEAGGEESTADEVGADEVGADEVGADAGVALTHAAFAAVAPCRAAAAAFFKRAVRAGRVVGATIKSDLGLRNRRSTSGALHLDRCPIVLWALPRVNERAGALSDVAVYANVRGRFTLTPAGGVCYVGPQPARAAVRADEGQRTLSTLDEMRASLATIESKMAAERWHALVLFSMAARHLPEADDWPRRRAAKRPRATDARE